MGRGIVESALRGGAGAPGLRLIETFRLGSPRAGLHRARMARGAAALGWVFAPARFDAALDGADPAGGERLRLTLGVAGDIAVEQSALPTSPSVWRLGLARRRLASGDPWLALKSTHRPAYDAERAGLAEGLDEALFLNERDEVCDGTITTLFFDRGKGLRTPPLACGLLPGVLRAEMSCTEEVLAAGDLTRVRLWVGNSLRGLMPAVWAG
ncbi:MAG: aminotransferase class IV [Paracoccaceae bacterium]